MADTKVGSTTAWRGEGLAKILNKGSSIFVEGSLRTSSFEGRDGQKRYRTEVNARNILLTGGRGGGGGGGGGPRREPEPDDMAPSGGAPDPGFPDDDDIPF